MEKMVHVKDVKLHNVVIHDDVNNSKTEVTIDGHEILGLTKLEYSRDCEGFPTVKLEFIASVTIDGAAQIKRFPEEVGRCLYEYEG